MTNGPKTPALWVAGPLSQNFLLLISPSVPQCPNVTTLLGEASFSLTLEAAQNPCDKSILPSPMASVPEPPVLLPLGLARSCVTSETL